LYAIETKDLGKKFPVGKGYWDLLMGPFKTTQITALQGINIEVKKGEVFGLLGPNGAGKTTLIKILCTLVLPSEGSALVYGFDVTRHEGVVKQLIGYVISEDRSFFWRLTGRQNLLFFSALQNLSRDYARKRINELTELVGLSNDIDNPFKNYSSGTKQKLALARGMLTDPEILFLDEPTRTLDPITTRKLRAFIREIIVKEQRKTIIIATNNMQEAEELCDRIAVLRKGKLMLCESVKNAKVSFNGNSRYIIELNENCNNIEQKLQSNILGAKIVNSTREFSDLSGSVLTVEIEAENIKISEIVRNLVLAGIRVETFIPKRLSLDEIFAKIVE
jgi:ABC-2 type transport system ATP-binding protein